MISDAYNKLLKFYSLIVFRNIGILLEFFVNKRADLPYVFNMWNKPDTEDILMVLMSCKDLIVHFCCVFSQWRDHTCTMISLSHVCLVSGFVIVHCTDHFSAPFLPVSAEGWQQSSNVTCYLKLGSPATPTTPTPIRVLQEHTGMGELHEQDFTAWKSCPVPIEGDLMFPWGRGPARRELLWSGCEIARFCIRR